MLVSGPAFAQEPAKALSSTAPGAWVAYEVPQVAGLGSPCCVRGDVGYDPSGRKTCSLDESGWQFDDDDGDTSALRIFLRKGIGGVDRDRALGVNCPIGLRGIALRTIAASPADSAEWLHKHALGTRTRSRDDAIPALALHDAP